MLGLKRTTLIGRMKKNGICRPARELYSTELLSLDRSTTVEYHGSDRCTDREKTTYHDLAGVVR